MATLARLGLEALGLAAVAAALALATTRFDVNGAGPYDAVAVAGGVVLYAVSLLLRRRAGAHPARTSVYLATTSLLLAALMLIGLGYRKTGNAALLVGSFGSLTATAVAAAGIALFLWRIADAAWLAGAVVGRTRQMRWISEGRPWPFWLLLLVLTITWLPTVVALAPGTTTYDGTRQINELIGAVIPQLDFQYFPTNHHPWFATLWQGTLLSSGMELSGGDINAGLLVHSLALVAASLATYAYVALRVQRLAGRGWALATLAFFAIIPHFANYAVLYEKTGWYQLALVWFFLGVVDAVIGDGRPVRVAAQLVIGGTLAALFRANGLYIVVPTLVVLAVVLLVRRARLRALISGACAVCVAALFGAWTNAALPAMGVMPSSPAEALVVSFQQITRIVAEDGASLSAEQRETIDAVLPLDELVAAYTPENGDPVKALYEIDSFLITDTAIEKMRGRSDWWRDESTTEPLKELVAAWPGLVLTHPATAVSATIGNTYLYFTPQLNRGADISLFTGGLPEYFVLANEHTVDYRATFGNGPRIALATWYETWAQTPGMNLFVNPGLYGWAVIALGVSLLFWRRADRLAVWVPLALVYVINFAGARNGDFRYVVPLLALLPLALAVWFSRGRGIVADAASRHHEAQSVTR